MGLEYTVMPARAVPHTEKSADLKMERGVKQEGGLSPLLSITTIDRLLEHARSITPKTMYQLNPYMYGLSNICR